MVLITGGTLSHICDPLEVWTIIIHQASLVPRLFNEKVFSSRNVENPGDEAISWVGIYASRKVEKPRNEANKLSWYGSSNLWLIGWWNERGVAKANMVVALPLGKLIYLGIKQISRPISRRIQAGAVQSPLFRKYVCIPPAQCKEDVYLLKLKGEGKP